jgi:hypothetical protein
MIKKLTLALFSVFIGLNLTSQTEYSLTHASSPYSEISSATTIYRAWNGEVTINLPFQFKYFNVNYGSFRLHSQGVAFSQSGQDNIFFGSENYIPDNNDTLLSPISYIISGTSPNRILKIQYKNIHAVLQDPQEEYSANYQMWFYETSNKFEFRFGPNVITDLNFTKFVIGFIDADNSPYLAISGTAAAPTLVRVTSALSFTGISTHPLNGQVYTFTPAASSTGLTFTNKNHSNYTIGQNQDYFTYQSQSNDLIELYNSEGRLVKTIETSKDLLTFESTQMLAKGLYILKISNNNQIYSEKLIVY